MTRVLVASHAGPSATGAVRIAPLVATRLGAELDLLGVLPPVPPVDYGYGYVYGGSPELDTELGTELRRELEAQLTQCGIAGCTPVVRRGQPATELASAARASGAELVVVGLGPHHALDRALGGETALQLVQVASTPVLAVPPGATRLPHRAVAAIDFTPSSLLAAGTAARLLGAGDLLRLVHVRTRDGTRTGAATVHAGEAPPPDAEARLAALGASLSRPDGPTVEHAIVDGPPARALLDEVARADADLIALGSHGYGLWKRLTLGSVASKVLRLATTCVLVQPIGSVATLAG